MTGQLSFIRRKQDAPLKCAIETTFHKMTIDEITNLATSLIQFLDINNIFH